MGKKGFWKSRMGIVLVCAAVLAAVIALVGFVVGFAGSLEQGFLGRMQGGIIMAVFAPLMAAGVFLSLGLMFGIPAAVIVWLFRRFGFEATIGAVLLFTPLFPVGILLLLHSKPKWKKKEGGFVSPC